jgi:tetratricopeptide (TPR) repeat protein
MADDAKRSVKPGVPRPPERSLPPPPPVRAPRSKHPSASDAERPGEARSVPLPLPSKPDAANSDGPSQRSLKAPSRGAGAPERRAVGVKPAAPAPRGGIPHDAVTVPARVLSAAHLMDEPPSSDDELPTIYRPSAGAARPTGNSETAERQLGHARALLEAIGRELNGPSVGVRRGRLEYERARLLESPLGDKSGAAEAYLRAHTLLVDHLPAIHGARRVLLSLGRADEALPLYEAEIRLSDSPERRAELQYEKACLLEDVLGRPREALLAFEAASELAEDDATRIRGVSRAASVQGAWEALDRALEREANAVHGDSRHRAAAIAARARLIEAHRGDARAAVELYDRALETEPRTAAPVHALKRLHHHQQRFRDLITVLEREAELASDASVRAACYYRIGRLWLDQLGALEEGSVALERAAQHAPADTGILSELARVHERKNEPKLQVAVLERLAEIAVSPAERLAYYEQIAELHATRLDDTGRAIEWYEKARALAPAYLPAVQALAELYEKRGEFLPLIAVHQVEAEAAREPSRRAAAHARVAEIYEQQLKRPEDAITHYSLALGIVPGQQIAFKALVRLFSEGKRFAELVSLYERAVDASSDAEVKVTYLYKIGHLYEEALEAPAQALLAYRRVLKVAPEDIGALHSMQRAAERAGLWKELINALELEAERTRDRRQKLDIITRAGEVAERRMNDDMYAVSFYKRLLEIDAGYAPAYSALGRVFQRAGRHQELLEIYKNELAIAPAGPGIAALHFRIATLCENELGRDEEAIQAYRKAVELDPTQRAARRALERKLEEKGRWDEIVRLLELEIAALDEPKSKARASLRIGEILENRLRNPDRALAAYEQALGFEPALGAAREGLVRLLSVKGDHRRLVEALEREAEVQADPRLSVSALLRAGQVYRDDLGEAARAIRCFETVLERDAVELEALFALESLYAAAGAWDALASVYATEARVLQDPKGRVGALRELARLRNGKSQVGDRGRQALGAILDLLPGDLGALEALEALALADNDHALLQHLHAQLAAALTDPISVAAHEVRLGERLEAAENPAALEAFRAALSKDPEAFGAVRGFSRIAERLADERLLEEAAEHESRIGLDLGRAAELATRAAEARLARGDTEGAVRALTRALGTDSDNEKTVERLWQLLVESNELDRLLGLLTQAARGAKKPERIAALWTKIAEIYADHKHDLGSAIAALERVLGVAVARGPLLLSLGELLSRAGQWDKAVERLEQLLQGAPDPASAVRARLRLASIFEEQRGDNKRARAELDAVLALEPDHRGALERRTALEARLGEHDLAAESALMLVRISPDPESRVRALSLLARVERQRGQLEASAHAYEQAVVLAGMTGNAARELWELVEASRPNDGPSFSRYAGALKRHLETASPAAPEVYAELSRVLAEKLRQNDEAVHFLERGIALCPEHLGLRAELAERLLGIGHFQRAIAELTRVIAADVRQPKSFRQLAEAFRGLERPAEATLALGPLVALGLANDLERTTWSLRPVRPLAIPPGAFGAAEIASIALRRGEDPTQRLLAALRDIVGKVNPPELERWNVSNRDRVSARSSHPLRQVSDRAAAAFGVGAYELYVHGSHAGQVEVELTDPISLLVPSHVTALSESEQAFLIARAMANISRGLAVVDRLAPNGIELLLAAAARLVEPNFGAGRFEEEYLAGLARRVAKSLPWIGRGPIEDAARAYADAPRTSTSVWVAEARITAARAALIAADDLPSSIALVRRLEGDLGGVEGDALAEGSALVDDLLRFWISEPAFALRRRLGL